MKVLLQLSDRQRGVEQQVGRAEAIEALWEARMSRDIQQDVQRKW